MLGLVVLLLFSCASALTIPNFNSSISLDLPASSNFSVEPLPLPNITNPTIPINITTSHIGRWPPTPFSVREGWDIEINITTVRPLSLNSHDFLMVISALEAYQRIFSRDNLFPDGVPHYREEAGPVIFEFRPKLAFARRRVLNAVLSSVYEQTIRYGPASLSASIKAEEVEVGRLYVFLAFGEGKGRSVE